MVDLSKTKYYYVTGNTSQGFVNYLSTNMKDIQQLIVLKHHSLTIKTAVLKPLIQQLEKLNVSLEILCSPFGDEYLEGVIARDWSVAVLSDTVITSDIPYAQEIKLSQWFPTRNTHTDNVSKQIQSSRENSYEKMARALKVHDDLENIYIKEMNFEQANRLTDDFIEELLHNIPKQNRTPHIYHRLFGTNTDQGAVNKLPEIIDDVSNRIYIKGRAGTGKSVFLNKVIQYCVNDGYDIEQYHCSFDPGSTDMVLIPALDVCVFDSTAPHELFPERRNDVVLDLYEETVTPGTDEKYAQDIDRITQKYKAILKEGIRDLKDAKFWQDQIEESYVNIDQVKMNKIVTIILDDLKK